jgi:hypothetical protein
MIFLCHYSWSLDRELNPITPDCEVEELTADPQFQIINHTKFKISFSRPIAKGPFENIGKHGHAIL